ncbi:MAG: AAA family ATPase [Candidatus Dadabacteria bacterium]|nr:MAG: AAA family ATPase [Candidatus Dadabacteria bacterium]
MKFDLVGHEKQRAALKELYLKGKLPHSILFCGPQGIGKKLVAQELASMLLCEERGKDTTFGGCGRCSACRLFLKGNLPDYHQYDCKEKFSTANVREALEMTHLRAYGGKNRVVLFDNIDHISIQSANILLKTLEEPGDDLYFFLIAENPAMLPDTVVSRCHKWHFNFLTKEEISRIHISNCAEKDITEILSLSGGSPGQIINILEKGIDWNSAHISFNSILEGNLEEAIALSEEIAKDRGNLRQYIAILAMATRNYLRKCHTNREKELCAAFLTKLFHAEKMTEERNININYLFAELLSELAYEKFIS